MAKRLLYSLAPLPSTLSSSLSPPPNREQLQTTLLSIVKLVAEILSLLVLIITLIMAFRKLTTNNTGNAIQTLPEGNVASSSTDGVTNTSNLDNIQLIALNFNPVSVRTSNIL